MRVVEEESRIEAEKAEANLQEKYGKDWKMSDVFKNIEKAYKDEKEDENSLIQSLYGRIQAILRKYMDMNEPNYHLLTLWIMGTYMYEEFNSFPLLFVNATKQSGKTRLLKILESLCWKGKIQANLSEAVLFRMKKLHTLLLDEFEQAQSKDKGTIREMINASYKKGAKVERMSKVKKDGKESYEVESFDLYSPLAMANIWGMDEVVEDRCIIIRLDRTSDERKSLLLEDFSVSLEIKSLVKDLNELKCRLCMLVGKKNIELSWNNWVMGLDDSSIHTLYTYTTLPTLPTLQLTQLFKKIKETKINGRQLELFFPLIFISEIFGEEMFDKTLEMAKMNFEEKNSDDFTENPDITFLDFLWRVFSDDPYKFLYLSEITNRFKLESPYPDECTPEKIIRSVKRLNIILQKKRDSKGRKILFDFAKIKEKLERYKEVINKDV